MSPTGITSTPSPLTPPLVPRLVSGSLLFSSSENVDSKTAQKSYCGDNVVLWTVLGTMPVLRDSVSYLFKEDHALPDLLLLYKPSSTPRPWLLSPRLWEQSTRAKCNSSPATPAHQENGS